MGKSIGLILALKDQCSPQMTKIAEKIGITEKEAKKLHTQINKLSKDIGGKLKNATVAVSAGLGAVVATAGVAVNKTAELGDRVDKLSQKIGLSRKGFQEWDYVCSQSGMQVESLQMGMKTLVNQIDGVTKGNKASIATFNKLGVSVKDSSGKLKNQEQVFNECVIALTKMKDGSAKAKIANDLFGRSGAELAPIINGNAQTITDLKNRAHELGLVMGDELVDDCVEYGDLMDDMKKATTMLGAGIASALMPSIIELQKSLINELPKIRATLLPALNAMANVVQFLIKHLDGLSVIATVCVSSILAFKAISGVLSIIQTLQAVIKAVSVAQGIWNVLMLANPIGLIATGVGLLIGGIVLLVKNWDKVTGAVKKAVDAMKAFVGIKPKQDVKVDNVEVKKNALGTAFSGGGLTLVGEHGAELVNMPKGASVTNANNTAKMLNGGRGVNVNITILGNMVGNDEFLNQLASVFARRLKVAMAVQ